MRRGATAAGRDVVRGAPNWRPDGHAAPIPRPPGGRTARWGRGAPPPPAPPAAPRRPRAPPGLQGLHHHRGGGRVVGAPRHQLAAEAVVGLRRAPRAGLNQPVYQAVTVAAELLRGRRGAGGAASGAGAAVA
jgi:hypothetical protein